MGTVSISPKHLHDAVQAGQTVDLIDVRTPAEYCEVHASFARNLPLDQLDVIQVAADRNGSSQPKYVICRSGGRGRQACEKFLAAGYSNVINVEGGTLAWEQAGLPVIRGKKTISLERQVRIAAGSLVLLGAILGWFVHPAFIGLSAFVGVGLIFAGVTDTCGMGMILAGMPWNQRAQTQIRHALDEIRQTGPIGVSIMKLIIVGGVAGGASAAARARRLSEDADIVLFERGPDVSFANCGLPYYVGGEIVERDKLLVATPEQLRTRFKLDVRTRSSVEAIDRLAKKVRVRNLASGEDYEETYDKLILAPGAPLRPPIPGIDLPGIFTLRNLQDVDRIKERVDKGVKEAVVVGAGFIGLELVENFVRRGVSTTVVELQDQILPPFDKEMTAPLVDALLARNVKLLLGQSAEAFEKAPDGLVARLKSGQRLPAQLIILGVGVRPENKLAVDAGLEVGPRGGIRVNENLQSSDPDIYAVGDAIEVKDFVSGDSIQVPLAGPANRQGRIAADNIFGSAARYRGTQGTAIVGVFDRVAAMTGASEKALRRTGRPYRKVYIHPGHHAGYFPGAEQMTLKLLFDPVSGRVLGAQAVGGAGVDKRIDVLAVAIQAGMTVFDLEEMELAYAPQFGSAKDPINMLGFVAGGLLRGQHPQVDVDAVLSVSTGERAILLDVRTPEEFASGHIPEAVNIPVDDLRSRLGEVPRDRQIAVYCQVGQRGYLATRILLQAGFNAVNLGGGYKTFELFHPNAA